MSKLLTEFIEFVATLQLKIVTDPPDDDFPDGYESTNWYSPDGKWWVCTTDDLPFTDFNKEVCDPDLLPDDPDGYVGIRVDDDFWSVAKLPFKFKDLTMQDIGQILWPDTEDATYNEEDSIIKNQMGIRIAK